jgi:hypothetical protein
MDFLGSIFLGSIGEHGVGLEALTCAFLFHGLQL